MHFSGASRLVRGACNVRRVVKPSCRRCLRCRLDLLPQVPTRWRVIVGCQVRQCVMHCARCVHVVSAVACTLWLRAVRCSHNSAAARARVGCSGGLLRCRVAVTFACDSVEWHSSQCMFWCRQSAATTHRVRARPTRRIFRTAARVLSPDLAGLLVRHRAFAPGSSGPQGDGKPVPARASIVLSARAPSRGRGASAGRRHATHATRRDHALATYCYYAYNTTAAHHKLQQLTHA